MTATIYVVLSLFNHIIVKNILIIPAILDECVRHTKELFSFTDNYRGKYSDVITDVQDFYQSWSGFKDELR